jgi:hypothetical protein
MGPWGNLDVSLVEFKRRSRRTASAVSRIRHSNGGFDPFARVKITRVLDAGPNENSGVLRGLLVSIDFRQVHGRANRGLRKGTSWVVEDDGAGRSTRPIA